MSLSNNSPNKDITRKGVGEVVKSREKNGDKTSPAFKFLGFCKTGKLKKRKITRSNVACGLFMKASSLMHIFPRFPGGCQCYTADVQAAFTDCVWKARC